MYPGFESQSIRNLIQELAMWYNDNVIYPDKVRLNLYYLKHYSFIKDIEMIFATVLGRHIEYNNEII